ncbi:thioesterase domain-containing protein, partial [Streptomyces sp. NPDC052236]|uniref:thioesterase domain-containing protein n=1 Tax=Streptomyces sp. NPDC052236 TaxID=3365686 RepID=UPI0037D047A4
RADNQIKIRGFRIEPSEIETTLNQHPAITHSFVTPHTDKTNHKQLIAYIVPTPPHTPDPTTLRLHLAQHLPDYMIPTTYITLDTLPLNPNGKVDPHALPLPEPAGVRGRAPRTMHEGVLCELFAEVLGVPHAGVDDNFFDLGGHSLLAPRLISRIKSVFGVALPIRRLFDQPTAAGLAMVLGEEGEVGSSSAFGTLFPLRTAGTAPPLFCIHPVAGAAWCYAGLPRHIGRDHPVYGLQDPGLGDAGQLLFTIADMAAQYVESIRSVRPEGPYHLAGWSFGGLVAHEVAVQLQRLGETVGLLCVLDGYPVERHPSTGRFARDVAGEDSGPVARLRRLAGVSVDLDRQEAEAVHRCMTNNIGLMREFVPGTFTGDLTFVTATEERGDNPPEAADWRPFVTGAIDEHHVPCGHLDMMRPDSLARIGSTIARRLGELTPDAPAFSHPRRTP